MKISLGMNLQKGPWGGGNQFGQSLVKYLQGTGADVSYDLSSPDIDIVLLTEPRANLRISSFTDKEIFRYLSRNKKTLVVHRVNECDERKGTHGVNKIISHANLCADHTVFVSKWLQELFNDYKIPCKSQSVILNGSSREIFHSDGHHGWKRDGPLRLITHHWGAHRMKGFDIYRRLDGLLGTKKYNKKISFTYVGNLPPDFTFKNVTYIRPKHGKDLADIIRQHHVYLTASRNEPGPNHQNEGANCGLPLLYLGNTSMHEYCSGFGVSFSENSFEQKLSELMNDYEKWEMKVKSYPYTADKMCDEYYELFANLIKKRENIISQRPKFKKVKWYFQSVVC